MCPSYCRIHAVYDRFESFDIVLSFNFIVSVFRSLTFQERIATQHIYIRRLIAKKNETLGSWVWASRYHDPKIRGSLGNL